ncbi:hypothetical protein Patl1_01334 [Pistacia atlantica]|uniref:Uncharacterized protein n=1 Tax=Pistacia atlantica TaxID=434234 RepID=A0ACC1C9K9_9ROSI|nr:hypothetical protein Patl1_01334 [Pistacia atlantica]
MMSPTDSDREKEEGKHLQINEKEQTKLQLMKALVEKQDPSSKGGNLAKLDHQSLILSFL